jgi:RHS repeat-associated protein
MEQGKLRMPRFMISRLVLMLIGSAFCAQPLLFAGAAPDQQAYVVTVRPDASIDGIPVIAKQMAASYGGTVVEGAGGGGDTFVIRVAKSRARMLSLDPHVKSVVPMGLTPAPQTVVETVPWSSGVSYSYDGTGNIMQIGNDTFAYDGVSRLSQATVNGIARKYDYDAFGNRTACTQLGPNDCQGLLINAAENKNRLAGTGYDAAGNVSGLSGHVYSYDPLNMMTRDSFGQLSREFVYTAEDERIATYTVGSSWNWTVRGTDGRVLREFTSSDGPAGPGTISWQWTKDDVWRNGFLLASRQPDGANTTTYHYHLDHLGTPRRVTDQNDRIVGVHDYLAFGPELSSATAEPSATALKYTGHERDNWSSGSSDALDYMHARYYSPWMGRFLSVDPVRSARPTAPQSWNRYAYAINNPFKYIDRNGQYYELASAADRQFFVHAITPGTNNKAARELLMRQAADPIHRIVLATGDLPALFQFGDSANLHPPFRVIAGNLFPAGITSTVDKGKLALVNYPTPTITTFHELLHVDIILYQGVGANGQQHDHITLNPATGQVTSDSIFEDFGRSAATTADDPMHALSEDQVSALIADPNEGSAKPANPCVSIMCVDRSH